MNISVIIPMFNAEKTLAYCVESAAEQAVSEILLVDDGSSDHTVETAERLKDRYPLVRIIRNPHGGVSKARNRGIAEAKGEWLCFLDADDRLTKNAVRTLTKLADRDTDAVCGGIVRGNKTAHAGGKTVTFTDVHDCLNYVMASPTDRLTIHGWLLRRSICTENEIFYDPDLRLGEDSDWILRFLALCRKVSFTDTPVYCYTISPVSTIHSWKPGKTAGYLDMLEQIGKTAAAGEKNWPLFALTNLLLILTHDTFHPANPAKSREQFAECSRLRHLPVFADAFGKADLSGTDLKKRLVLLCFKAERYRLCRAAIRIRQRQNAGNA